MKSNDYHPIWYQRNRPYAKFSKQTVAEYGFSGSAIQAIQDRISREWNTALELKKVNKNDISTDLMPEISLAFYYGAFAANGYNLFSFTPHIGEMLANTKATEVPISALKSPYPVYFIQFHESVLWGNLEITGSYIIDDPIIPVLQVCLILKPLDESAYWMASPSGYFYLPLPKESDKPLGELIQHTIDSEITQKWEHATKSMPIEGNSIVDIRELRAKRETMDLSSGRQAIQKAMEYVANCLCYLSSHSRFDTGYPSDAPTSLIDKLTNAKTEKQKLKAQSQLKSMGYLTVTYIRLDSKDTPVGAGDEIGNGKKQHWRRGHWRNQRKGKELSLSELIWIKPALVGEDSSDNDDVREYRLT